MPVQERRGIDSEAVMVILLGKQAADGQEIAQYARPFLRGVNAFGDGLRRSVSFGDGREEIQLNGAAQRGGAHMGIQGFKNDGRRRSLGVWCGGHGTIIAADERR